MVLTRSGGREMSAKILGWPMMRCFHSEPARGCVDFGRSSVRMVTMWIRRSLPLITLLLVVLWSTSASASSTSSPAPSPSAPSASASELEQLVETLKDDRARAAFLGQLQELIAAKRAVSVKAAEPQDLVAGLSHHINALIEEVLAGMAVLVD